MSGGGGGGGVLADLGVGLADAAVELGSKVAGTFTLGTFSGVSDIGDSSGAHMNGDMFAVPAAIHTSSHVQALSSSNTDMVQRNNHYHDGENNIYNANVYDGSMFAARRNLGPEVGSLKECRKNLI
jgi:hypothetical protein